MSTKGEMTISQVRTLNSVIAYKLFGHYAIKSLEVEPFDFCSDVQITLVVGWKDTDLFDECYIFSIGSRGGLTQVNKKGNKLVRCKIQQLRNIWSV